jgi:Mg-chelatase subunit ChlI
VTIQTRLVNAQLMTEGLARLAKQVCVDALVSGMVEANVVVKLAAALNAAPGGARKTRGDDDPDAI